ncbi:MAG: hypothetical protein LQ351_006264 [Letrouitia transgressa]|nr:MAG: hypothetical protein LQ351_006264 [Letrouitia transgressa]
MPHSINRNLLVVFGSTGQQGGSVANYVAADPELSRRYNIRGVTRDNSKSAAQALAQQGVEVVSGDLDDESSIKDALRGAHTVFAMTRTIYDDQAKAREVRQGKGLADTAVAAGAKYFIYSTESHAGDISGGKYPVDAYDAKADVEQYIRQLPIQSAFFAPATFMQNFAGMMAPRPTGDGTYAIANIHSPDAKFPWLDVVNDSGKFVGAILAEPEKYEGKVLAAAAEILSLEEAAAVISKVTKKTVKYSQMPEDKYRSFLPPSAADGIVNMFLYIQDHGYYGPQTGEAVAWSVKQARGKLTTFEEYLAKSSLKLA